MSAGEGAGGGDPGHDFRHMTGWVVSVSLVS